MHEETTAKDAGERLHSESSNTRPVDIVIAEHCGDFQIFTSPELQPDTHTRSHTDRRQYHHLT